MNPIEQRILVAAALFLSSFVCARVAKRRPALVSLRVPLLASAVIASLEAVRAGLALFAGREGFAPPAQGLEALAAPLAFLFYFSLAVVGIRLVRWTVFDLFLQRQRHLQAPDVLKDIVSFAIYVIAFVAIFQRVFHTSLTPILATSAVLTAVIGLAMQDSLGNLFAGISLRMEESLSLGDWVGIGGSVGKVVEMRWRALKLLTIDGDIVIFPNGMAAKERIENYSHPAEPHARRLLVGVSYTHPPAKVIDALADLVSRVAGVLAHPPIEIKVADYQDFSILYEIKYWLSEYPRHRPIEGEIRRLIWYRFQREGIEIPFPIRTVRFQRPPGPAEAVEEDARQADVLLGSIEIFSPLSDEERRWLALRSRRLRFAPGEVVVRQGDPGASFYVIETGRLQAVASRGEAEASSRLAGMGQGEFFGEISLLTGEPRSATVLAESDCVVREIGADVIREILAARPAIAESLSRILGQRKITLEQKLSEGQAQRRAGLEEEAARNFLHRIRAFFGI